MILVTNQTISMLKIVEKYNDSILAPYSRESFFYRQIRKVCDKTSLPFIEKLIYNQQLRGISDCIVVFDACITGSFLKWLKKNNKYARIIFWYWNPVEKSISLDNIPEGIEIWSYSKCDCDKFNLRHNTQFFFNELVLEKEEKKYDIFFAGVDKGRRKDLLRFQTVFNKLNITYKIEIVPTRWYLKWLHKDYTGQKSYDIILGETNKCSAILDLYVNRKAGNSLRVMEALFLKKKLITNNSEISKEKIYSPDYIFLLGEREIKELKHFLEEPVEADLEQLRKYYSYEQWKERFMV